MRYELSESLRWSFSGDNTENNSGVHQDGLLEEEDLCEAQKKFICSAAITTLSMLEANVMLQYSCDKIWRTQIVVHDHYKHNLRLYNFQDGGETKNSLWSFNSRTT
ncbi:uncharacterized protein LOC132623185 isoform X2 [Lycium barbarum]|uniref:uncharacterized protein LOC132623185 isoform X2 n=1 Tax=Lycium barbarum TaxID=112863 RepID=UPI00293EA585|nr:uncharacterized protein LOC132623185 isoform X2 [Lycium barbarum]XP_060193883.1 uncharacterized protein LOC132623185 isoform X2 [Lycium barbarum]